MYGPVSQALSTEYVVNYQIFAKLIDVKWYLSVVSLIMNETHHLFLCLWAFFSINSLFVSFGLFSY